MKAVSIKIEHIVILFFMAAMILYLRIDGLPITHPGNIKAADGTYHVQITERILDTKQWNYNDLYVTLGQEKAPSFSPPLLYINSAILSTFSGVPSWVSVYFLVCLSQAFFIIAVFLITTELFENKLIGLIASGLSILPMPVFVWLYGLSIGFWIQVVSYFFVLAFLWLFLKYLKTNKTIFLFFLGIIFSAVILLHPVDPGVTIAAIIILGLKIFSEIKNPRVFLRKVMAFSVMPLPVILALLPKIFFIWMPAGAGQMALGFYGLPRDLYKKDDPFFMVAPYFSVLPLWVLIFFILGFAGFIGLIILNLKGYGFPSFNIENKNLKLKMSKTKKFPLASLSWAVFTLSYFFILYISPSFLKDPYYLSARTRALQPFIIFPMVAFFIYGLVMAIKNIFMVVSSGELRGFAKTKMFELTVCVFLIVLVTFASAGQYNDLVSKMQYEHVSLDEWNAYLWVQQNTPIDARIMFFGGDFQSEAINIKRIVWLFTMDDLQRAINDYIQTNQTPLIFHGGFDAVTLRGPDKYEVSYWDYRDYDNENSTGNILDFDYVFFQDLNAQIAQVNRFFASKYIEDYNFRLVYDKNGYFILKNEKQ
jgi:hypothetical protein